MKICNAGIHNIFSRSQHLVECSFYQSIANFDRISNSIKIPLSGCTPEAIICIVYPKKYAHGFCFAVLCCGYTLTDFPISIRLTSLALWQSKDCPSASKATLMNMDKYLMWIHYERLHNHNKAKHNKTVCIFLGIYCTNIAIMKHDGVMTWICIAHSGLCEGNPPVTSWLP